MEPPALPSCSHPRRRADGNVLLPWGERPDGSQVHIADVPSGLTCDCVCPGCGARLVAVKGAQTEHHFRHHNAVPCRQAFETALHKLAKDVLNEELELLLPDVAVTIGSRSLTTFPAERHKFDGAVLEHRLGDIVPDVIVRRGKHELLVEMVVTHRCDAEKIAKIEALGLSCVEIDLSRMPRDASRTEVATALLGRADRVWINNPKIGLAAERLQQTIAEEEEARRRAAAKAAEVRRRKLDAMVEAIEEHRDNPITFRWPDSETVEMVAAAGFGSSIGKSVVGDFIFALAPREWQSRLLRQFVLSQFEHQGARQSSFDTKAAINFLHPNGLLRAGVPRFIDAEDQFEISASVPEFIAPFRVVEAYLDWLARQDVLAQVGKRYSVSAETRREWAERVRRKQALAQQAIAMRIDIGRILGALPAEESGTFSIDRWWLDELPPFGTSPGRMFETDHARLTELRTGIDRIEVMLVRGGGPVEDSLGLPVAAARARAEAAKAEAVEQARREEEQRRREQEQKLKAAALRRTGRLAELARKGLDDEAGQWLATPHADLQGRAPRAAAEVSDDGYWKAEYALTMATHARAARLKRERLRNDLVKAADRTAKPDHANLFLKASNPLFHNRRPIDACEDEASFQRIRVAMLEAIR